MERVHRRRTTALFLLGCSMSSGVFAQEPPESSKLQETVESHRIQVDVSVQGPREALESLTVDDLTVRAGLKKVPSFTLDRLCPLDDETPTPVTAIPTSYLFYFDQTQLTLNGRKRSLSIAHELILQLSGTDSKMAIVSNAQELQTVSNWSNDPAHLKEALKRLENDFTQFDSYPSQESTRVADVAESLAESRTVQQAIARARTHEKEETWRARKSFQRVRSVLGRFAEFNPPRVVILFTDTLRSNAGEHYTRFFGDSLVIPGGTLASMKTDAGATQAAFDSLIHDLITRGVRLYSVESSNFSTNYGAELSSPGGEAAAVRSAPSGIGRIWDARQTMDSLASETGGRSYAQNATANLISKEIRKDLECVFLIGFDADRFREDTVHALKITSSDPRVKLTHRGLFINTSDEARLRTRMLAAFVNPEDGGTGDRLPAYMIPLGFSKGRWQALLQIQFSGSPTARTAWDLGASLVGDERVLAERSRRIELDAVGTQAAYETEISFKPGILDLLAVARESKTNLILSGTSRQDWQTPNPERSPPVQILQEKNAVMIRDEETRSQGLWVLGENDPLIGERSAAFVGVACRGKAGGDGWSVERQIQGQSVVSFPSVPLKDRKNRCLQVRDLVPPASLGAGDYIYRLQVSHRGKVLHVQERAFTVQDNS